MISEYHKHTFFRTVSITDVIRAEFLYGIYPIEVPQLQEEPWELIYCLDRMVFEVDADCKWKLEPNEYLLIRPGSTHTIHSLCETGRGVRILFTCVFMDRYSRSDSVQFQADVTMQTLFFQIIHELQTVFRADSERLRCASGSFSHPLPYGTEQALHNYLELFLIMHRRKTVSALPQAYSRHGQKSIAHQWIAGEITAFICNHLSEDLSTKSIADAFHYSRAWLCTIYKQETGMGIKEMIEIKRIEAAKHQLRCTDKSITEIADDLGFSSLHYFTQRFTEKVGCSPTKYRRDKS